MLPGNDVGVTDWRSVVSTAEGVWFRAQPDRMMLLPRGGGTAEWLSQPVRDTLRDFPVTTGVAICTQENTVTWAVQNAGGTAGRLVSYDTRAGVWYVDTLEDLGGGPVRAITEHLGRLVVVVGTTVYRQDASHPGAAFLPLTVRLGAFAPAGPDGWFRLKGFTSLGKFKGVHEMQARVSFDDGLADSFLDCRQIPTLVDDDLAVDETVEMPWYPVRRKGARATIELQMTASESTPSQGQTLTALELEIIGNRKASRKRKKTH
jgi:hypothetical protein